MKAKKILSSLLILSMLFTNLTIVNAAGGDDEKISVPEGTFVSNGSDEKNFITNLDGIEENSNWQKSDIGITGISDGDSFLLSESEGDNFVYETDVKFNERKGAASLVFRASDDLETKNMYVANVNGETGEARLFKFEKNDVVDLGKSSYISLTENNEYHLKVTVIDKHMVYYINGELVMNTADYTMNTSSSDSHYGQNDVISEGLFGLLTWNGNVTYQNVEYTPITADNSPRLTGLTIASNDGKVDKQIQFASGQYVYITYVTNATTSVKLLPEIGNDSIITASDEDGNLVDINNLPVTKDLQTYTLTVRNGDAKVLYRVRVHRQQPDEVYYNEDYRGQYHYSVKDGWANDPNGMVYFNGEYHLFYQYYDSDKWGPMHWAHATSTDLITWEEHPIEFYPDEYGTMYSGCAVIADHETAPEVFAEGEEGIFFFITANGTNGADGQRIIGAYSKDGKTFQKYDEGKVLLDWKDDPLYNTAFRDPKVFRYEGKWFMVVAGGPLRIYSSDDLINWETESTYPELNTECPDLYPIEVTNENGEKTGEVKWVLDRGGRKYKIGDFKQVNGKWTYIPEEQYASTNANGMGNEDNDGIMNFGMDSYAAMTYYQGDFGTADKFIGHDIIAINWMNTWDSSFCNTIPDVNGNTVFNGTFNLQLKLGVTKDSEGNYYLTQTPIKEYNDLRDTENAVVLENATINENNELLSDFSGDSYEIVANLRPDANSTEVGFKVRTGDNQETVIKYDIANNLLTMDRTKSGILILNDERININSQAVTRNADGSIDLHIYVDRSSVEVFTKDYTVAGAMQIFASPVSQGLSVYSKGGNTTGTITVYPLKSIWTDKITPTSPIAVGLDKTSFNGYVGDEFTLNGWVSPSEVSQDIVYSVDNDSVVSLVQDGNKATITALSSGTAIVTAASATDPSVKKECVVQVRENNFKTNLSDFTAVSGNWYIDGESYYGSHSDNAFLFANKLDTDEFKYEIDATYETGILNFIFQSQTTNVWDGCYALQLNGNTVRLFDFKNDYTFTSTNTLVRPGDNQYHIEINVKGNNIVATVNGVEYINHTVTEADRQYSEGYVGLGLYNAAASYQNFYVTTDTPVTKITTKIDDLTPAINASLEDIKSLLPQTVTVAGDDNLDKKDPVAIDWDLSAVDVNTPGTYVITGTIDGGITTTVNVMIRSSVWLTALASKEYSQADYTVSSYQNYLEALVAANDVLANANALQDEIDQATVKLNVAILSLVSIKDLNEAVNKYQGLDEGLYTSESYQAYLDALNNAKTVLAKEDATQSEVNEALASLNQAVESLVKVEADPKPGDTQKPTNPQKPSVPTGDEFDINGYATLLGLTFVALSLLKKKRVLNK